MSDKFDEFLDEVQQDIKQEKYQELWNRYGKSVTAGAVALLLAAAGYVMWNRYEGQQRIKSSEALFSVQKYLMENRLDEARAILDTMKDNDSATYGYLRDFQKAAVFREKGDQESITQALAIYNRMAAHSKIPAYIREYASFLALKMAFDFNITPTADILKALEPLAQANAPWRFFAHELMGLIHYTQSDYVKALEVFASLAKEKTLPESMRMRVHMMNQLANQNMGPVQDMTDDDADDDA